MQANKMACRLLHNYVLSRGIYAYPGAYEVSPSPGWRRILSISGGHLPPSVLRFHLRSAPLALQDANPCESLAACGEEFSR